VCWDPIPLTLSPSTAHAASPLLTPLALADLDDVKLPGNFGFDPLNLGVDEEQLKWYAQAELQNARWAMLGVAGILGAELTGHDWFTAGSQTYFADAKTLFVIQLFLFSWVEFRRLQDYRKPGSANQVRAGAVGAPPPGCSRTPSCIPQKHD